MPYPYAVNLLLWPSSSEKVDVTTPISICTGEGENCFLLLTSGHASVTYFPDVGPEEQYSMNMEHFAVLGRNISITIESAQSHPCQIMYIMLKITAARPYIDLNHLCMTVPLVDSFFSYKTRFTLIKDSEYTREVFSSIIYELQSRKPEWEHLVHVLLQSFMIKLARSYYMHNQSAGIQHLATAKEYIRNHYREELTIEAIANHIGISRSYLSLLFSKYMQYTAVDFIHAVRCDHASYLLRTTQFTILEIALEVGFTNRQHFTRTFGKIYGVTPAQYRNGHHFAAINQEAKKRRS